MKIIARALLPFLTIWLVISPARSYAFVPIVIAGAEIASVAAESSAGTAAIDSAMALGTLITAMVISRIDSAGTQQQLKIYTTNAPRTPTPTETAAGYTPGYPAVIPPSTSGAPTLKYFNVNSAIGFNSGNEACQDFANSYGAGVTGTWVAGTPQCIFSNIGQSYAANITWASSCPAGYSVSGSSCVLANAAQVVRPQDNFCPILRTGNTYGVDPTDPDCSGAGAAPQFFPDGSWTISDGKGRTVTQTMHTDGSSTLTSSVPDPATNTTKTRTINYAAPATAADPLKVSGVTDTTTTGTGTAATTATPQTVQDAGTAAAVQANTAAIQQLQNDLNATGATATVATAATAAAANLANELAAQPQSVTDRGNGLGLPSLPAFLFPSFQPAACVPPSITFQGHTITFDFCPYVPTIKRIEAFILYVLTAYAAYHMIINFRAMRLRG